MWSVSDNLLRVHVMGSLLVVGVEMSFGGFIITRAPLFLRSYMTEMTHTDTQKKRTVIAFFPPPFSPPVHITAEI